MKTVGIKHTINSQDLESKPFKRLNKMMSDEFLYERNDQYKKYHLTYSNDFMTYYRRNDKVELRFKFREIIFGRFKNTFSLTFKLSENGEIDYDFHSNPNPSFYYREVRDDLLKLFGSQIFVKGLYKYLYNQSLLEERELLIDQVLDSTDSKHGALFVF